jgi:hypothetical protein
VFYPPLTIASLLSFFFSRRLKVPQMPIPGVNSMGGFMSNLSPINIMTGDSPSPAARRKDEPE